MKQTVTESMFIDAFMAIRPDNFSYKGLIALYEWFDELDNDCGTETELDVIAICCDFSEYANIEEFQRDYCEEYETIDDIIDHTTVIQIDEESFIVQDF